MRFETFTALMAIRRRWPAECAKIMQSLLAVSFDPRRGGFVVQNRLSEGIDLELSGPQKFAIEVKTSHGTTIVLSQKDIAGLRAKFRNDGYVPAVAALALKRSADWVIANAKASGGTELRLTAATYSCERLALDPIPELQEIARREFPKAVSELKDAILKPPRGMPPLEFLRNVLDNESRADVPPAPVRSQVPPARP